MNKQTPPPPTDPSDDNVDGSKGCPSDDDPAEGSETAAAPLHPPEANTDPVDFDPHDAAKAPPTPHDPWAPGARAADVPINKGDTSDPNPFECGAIGDAPADRPASELSDRPADNRASEFETASEAPDQIKSDAPPDVEQSTADDPARTVEDRHVGFQVTNVEFIAAVIRNLPEGAFAAICSKPGDPELGGYIARRADKAANSLAPENNNYLGCSSFYPGKDGLRFAFVVIFVVGANDPDNDQLLAMH